MAPTIITFFNNPMTYRPIEGFPTGSFEACTPLEQFVIGMDLTGYSSAQFRAMVGLEGTPGTIWGDDTDMGSQPTAIENRNWNEFRCIRPYYSVTEGAEWLPLSADVPITGYESDTEFRTMDCSGSNYGMTYVASATDSPTLKVNQMPPGQIRTGAQAPNVWIKPFWRANVPNTTGTITNPPALYWHSWIAILYP